MIIDFTYIYGTRPTHIFLPFQHFVHEQKALDHFGFRLVVIQDYFITCYFRDAFHHAGPVVNESTLITSSISGEPCFIFN